MPPPPPPPSPADAADQAIRTAQMASARGDFEEAENQSRIAERFSRIAQRAPDFAKLAHEPGEPCPLCGQTPRDLSDDGTAFRLDLERRINRVRLEERRVRDELKGNNRKEWDRQYALARMDAMTRVYETWEGDARAFHHPPQDADAQAA